MPKRVKNEDKIEDTDKNDIEIINIEKVKDEKVVLKLREEICKVVWVKYNFFGVDFKGYGITFSLDYGYLVDNIKDNIKIKYESEIGKEDFKAYPMFK